MRAARRAGYDPALDDGSDGSLDALILGLSPYSFVESDYYALDGISGKVSAFIDKVLPGTGIRAITANHAQAQANAANQCVAPAASTYFSNRPVADFNAAVEWYLSNAPASAWSGLHDGTGFTGYHVASQDTFVGAHVLCATYTGVGAGNGIRLAAGQDMFCPIVALNAFIAVAFLPVTAFTIDVATIWTHSYIEGRAPNELIYKMYASTANANTAGAPNAAAPGTAAGLSQAGVEGWQGKWAMSLYFNRILTASEDTTVRQYIAAKYGVV